MFSFSTKGNSHDDGVRSDGVEVAVQYETPSDSQNFFDGEDESSHLEATVVKHVYHKDSSSEVCGCMLISM